MPHENSRKSPPLSGRWAQLVVLIALVGLALYSAWQRQQDQERIDGPAASHATKARDSRTTTTVDPETEVRDAESPFSSNSSIGRTTIRKQTIRNENGKIVFQGDVDLQSTLARIERGERLGFTHDGIVFQNRERRLPSKPAGYYHEYIHPTPGVGGPGPQRIIRGRNGETYYTPDHYRTFQRIDE